MARSKYLSFDMSLYRPPTKTTDEREIDIHVKARFMPGWNYPNGYYDKSLGGWLPGDPPESEIIEVTTPGHIDFWPELTEDDKNKIYEEIDNRIEEGD